MDESLYIVTAINGASVLNSFYDGSLIVVYNSAVEFYKINNSLELESRISLNARASCAAYFGSQLFILTQKCQLLAFNNKSCIGTLELREESARMAENGHIMIIDPTNSYIACHIYQGLIKVIPVESIMGNDYVSDSKKGKRKVTSHRSPFNLRLKELLVVDMIFLSTPHNPCLVILHQDSLENLHIVSYIIDFETSALVKSDLIQETKLTEKTHKLISLTGNWKGNVLAISQSGFTLISPSETKVVYENSENRMICAWEWMDNNTLLTVDHNGSLDQFKLGDKSGKDWELKSMGIVSQATSLTKLSNNLIFVGSHYADSQLVNYDGDSVEVVDSITNLAPMIDFCLVDFQKRGQSQVVACCGAHKDGSLRVIRNGIGIEEIGELGELSGITGLFSLRQAYDSKFDSILAISFVAETRFQIMNDGVLEELEDTNGLVTSETTVLCANVKPDSIVQITPTFVFLMAQKTLNRYASWNPPDNKTIVTASVNDSQILLGISGGSVAYLEIVNGELSPVSVKKFKNEISSVNIKMDALHSNYCAIGTWTDVAVRILKLPGLEEVEYKKTPGDVVPRSILISELSNHAYLFVGLGDGTLVIYSFDKETGSLNEPKKYTIGTQQIRLIHFSSNGMDCVLAGSDHPSVIHNEGGKLRFANVNIKDLNYIVPFNLEISPHALSYVTNETLKIGLMEQIQRIHIKTIPMGETVRRITHQADTHIFGLVCTAIMTATQESSTFKILDENTYDCIISISHHIVMDTFKMEQNEIAQCLISVTLDFDDVPHSYFIVGTAFILPAEEEPTQGRILVFEVNKFRKIILCHELETKGCVYSLSLFDKNMIIASINSGVFLYKFEAKENEQISLDFLCSYHGYILAVSVAICGAFIIVGDLIKSVSVLTYDPTENKIKEAYRDYATNYMTCVEAIDEDVFLGADNASNVFTLKRSENLSADNNQLEDSAQYHLGDMINQFRHGSLVLPLNEAERMIEPKIIYGTLSGSLGIIAKISKSLTKLLVKMEKSMNTHVKPVGNLSHDKWRTFLSERGHFILENRHFIDGNLIESYIDLDEPLKEAIYQDLKDEIDSMDGLVKLIEEISRSH